MDEREATIKRGEAEMMGPDRCNICLGFGNYPCVHCVLTYDPPDDCDACEGLKEHTCTWCNGNGKVHRFEDLYEFEDKRLRDVNLNGYRLQTWDAVLLSTAGRNHVAYRLTSPEKVVIFEGDDYGCSRMNAVDGDDCLRNLLSFLTLREGDTDAEYFYKYSPNQWEFSQGPAEQLSMWSMEPEHDEGDRSYLKRDEDGEPTFFLDWVEEDEGEAVPEDTG